MPKTISQNKSQFKIDTQAKIKASQSIGGQNHYQGSTIEERKKKDTMNFLSSPRDNALSVAHELPNDKNLEVTPGIDTYSKRTRRSKNSRIGSRDGSRKGKRHK